MRGPAFGIESLSLQERLDLLERLWDSLSQRPSDVPFAEAQRRDLALRLDSPEEDVRSGAHEVSMHERRSVSTGSPYEPIVGISRAVRIGNMIAVAGTAPLDANGQTVGKGDVAAQARRCFEISLAALEQLGASKKDVIRTRIILTRIDDWRAVAEVHGEIFSEVRPANTIMQVSRFVDRDWLVETEIDAVSEAR